MSKDQDAPPAFPQKEPLSSDCHGMTLRDYFAAKAMQAFISEVDGPRDDHPGCPSWTTDQVAQLAYSQADRMLEARKA